nr:MAG TPA: hypothetical protein [Caudoviricetes sp.]
MQIQIVLANNTRRRLLRESFLFAIRPLRSPNHRIGFFDMNR